MIALTRIRTEDSIKKKYRGASKKSKEKELLKMYLAYLNNSESNKTMSFDEKYWKDSKVQLKEESKGKCAYCEADTSIVAHGDVEHYRPKSIYWWLAYTYDNYLFSCQICNQIFKNDNFPIEFAQMPSPNITSTTNDSELNILVGNISPDPIDVDQNFTLQKFWDEHNNERPLLLNPYFDNPSIYFAYEADDILEEVKIVPKDKDFLEYVEAAEEYLGINRIELKNARYEIFKSFRLWKKVYFEESIPTDLKIEIKSQIDEMMDSESLFAGMVRYFDYMYNEPPQYLDQALVVCWAWSGDKPFGIVAEANENNKMEIFGLAICKYDDSDVYYRFSCDKNWVVVQDMDYESARQAIEELPKQYSEQKQDWVFRQL